MEEIKRESYLNELSFHCGNEKIKILTGVRGGGKTRLLHSIKEEFFLEIEEKNKIYLDFENHKLCGIKTYEALNAYLISYLSHREKKVIFLDEINRVKDWEKTIENLRDRGDCEVYIASSTKIASEKKGKIGENNYLEFQVFPLTFREFMKAYSNMKIGREILFYKYILLGGLPFLRYFKLEDKASFKYLEEAMNTILMKDVMREKKVRDVEILQEILFYIMKNVGNHFSANSIKSELEKDGIKVSVDTIIHYLEFCLEAFLLYKVARFDLQTQKKLKIDEKYYLADHGLRSAKGCSNTKDIERTLENIVFIDLITRGYEIQTGKLGSRGMDFLAKKENRVEYYQVAYLLQDEEERKREFEVCDEIEDNYPKFILSMDKEDFSRKGIVHKNIIEFLLED